MKSECFERKWPQKIYMNGLYAFAMFIPLTFVYFRLQIRFESNVRETKLHCLTFSYAYGGAYFEKKNIWIVPNFFPFFKKMRIFFFKCFNFGNILQWHNNGWQVNKMNTGFFWSSVWSNIFINYEVVTNYL